MAKTSSNVVLKIQFITEWGIPRENTRQGSNEKWPKASHDYITTISMNQPFDVF